MITSKRLPGIVLLWIAVPIMLSACGMPSTAQPVEELAIVTFAQVEVGLGSPTPVGVTVDVSYPSTCTQFSKISQKLVRKGSVTKFVIEVQTMDTGGPCLQEAHPFRMILPINAGALPKGKYAVEVNGVDAGSFEFQH